MSTFSASLLLPILFILLCHSRAFPAIPNICKQPPPHSEGLCTIEIEGFYYDAETQDCQMYAIGACRLTRGQSFGNKQDCIATCVHGTRRIKDLYINE